MSDGMEIDIEGDSAEAVALALLRLVAKAEGKLDKDGDLEGVDRAWILDTYAECLQAVDGDRAFAPGGAEDDEDDDDLDDDDVFGADAEDGGAGRAEEPGTGR